MKLFNFTILFILAWSTSFAQIEFRKNPSIEIRCETTALFLKDSITYRFVGRRDFSLAKSYSGQVTYTTPSGSKKFVVEKFKSNLTSYFDLLSYSEMKKNTDYDLEKVMIEQLYSLPGNDESESIFLIKDNKVFEKFDETILVPAYFKTTFYGDALFADAICILKQFKTQGPPMPFVQEMVELDQQEQQY